MKESKISGRKALTKETYEYHILYIFNGQNGRISWLPICNMQVELSPSLPKGPWNKPGLGCGTHSWCTPSQGPGWQNVTNRPKPQSVPLPLWDVMRPLCKPVYGMARAFGGSSSKSAHSPHTQHLCTLHRRAPPPEEFEKRLPSGQAN